MLDILQGIWDFIASLFDFVIDTIKGLADLVVNLAKLPGFFADILSNSMIPGVVLASITGTLAVFITLRILNRD